MTPEKDPWVEVRPDVQGGTPVVGGTRIPLSTVLRYTREGWEHTEVPVRLRLRLGEYPLSSVCCTPAGEVPRTSTSVCSQPSRVYLSSVPRIQ